MTISRRIFVSTSLLAAAAISVPSVFAQTFKERDGNPGEIPAVQTDPLANYSKASFESYLNSIFQIQTAQGVLEVSLARVNDMPAPKGGECFTLLFRGGSRALRQDTYAVVHPALGMFQLFLVPAASDQNGAQEYVATINRLAPVDYANMAAPSRGQRSSTTTTTAPAASPTPSVVIQSVGTTVAPIVISTPPAHPAKPSKRRKRKPSWKVTSPKDLN